ncbi:MAG TPA: anthrone oxygenase family protein [Actinomycetes bacterium]|nr:anthrone oxygenase family protein [Actinomycetes bacterium]
MDDLRLTGGQALNGLLAGTYLALGVAVMPALHGLPDDTFVRVMNRINVVIVNPLFLTLFLGAPVLAVILAIVRSDPLTIAAAVAAVSVVVTTIAVNVPLNDALTKGGTREAYEGPWVLWHYFRTGVAAVAFSLLCIATS